MKDSDGKAETGDSEMSEEEEPTNMKKLKKVEGKRVTSKVSKVSRLKSITLAGKRGRVKKSVLLSAGMKRNKVLPAKVKASLTTVKVSSSLSSVVIHRASLKHIFTLKNRSKYVL